MSEEPAIPDETLISALDGRGYSVQKKDEPVTREAVQGWVREALEARRADNKPDDPAAQERTFAGDYLSALNRSRSQWLGEDDGDGT